MLGQFCFLSGQRSVVGEDRHAKFDRLRPPACAGPAETVELGGGGVEAALEPFHFTEAAITTGFTDAFPKVVDDLAES